MVITAAIGALVRLGDPTAARAAAERLLARDGRRREALTTRLQDEGIDLFLPLR